MGNKYIFTSKNMDASIVFKFDLNGDLIYFEIDGETDSKQRDWIYSRIPINESWIEAVWKKLKTGRIEKTPTDLSFEAFWEAYKLKVGKKSETKNIWNKMDENERIKALIFIKTYDNQLRLRQGQQKKYPSTYLNAQEWNN